MKNHGFVLLLAAALILSACAKGGVSRSGAGDGLAAVRKSADSSGGGSAKAEAGGIPEEGAARSRKLVRNASIRLRVQDPEAAEGPLTAAMEKYGGSP